jgi:hypothetical protein
MATTIRITTHIFIFKLNETYTGATDSLFIYNNYLVNSVVENPDDSDIYLYFNCYVNLGRYTDDLQKKAEKEKFKDQYEYIKGNAAIADYGVCSNNDYGFIKLKEVAIKDNLTNKNVNPISFYAWQFIRLYLPHIFYGDKRDPEDGGISVNSLAGYGNNILGGFKHMNKIFHDKEFAMTIDNSKSWIRLKSPTKVKYGGGCRVKSIYLSDNWEQMGGDRKTYSYGQEYTYTTSNGSSVEYSSGVAAYEPLYGLMKILCVLH